MPTGDGLRRWALPTLRESPAIHGDRRMGRLEAHDVSQTYREGHHEVHALRGVSLSVDRGEVVAIEGPSGSGKTTLLCILGCLLTPTSGRVIVDGHAVDRRRPGELRDLRRRSIGFVFQQ